MTINNTIKSGDLPSFTLTIISVGNKVVDLRHFSPMGLFSLHERTKGAHMKKDRIINLLLFALVILLAYLAIQAGKVNLSELDPQVAKTIFYKIRFPRVLAAIFVGSALATSGVILQGLLQNPLADSYTLGIASGGAFGACLAIFEY